MSIIKAFGVGKNGGYKILDQDLVVSIAYGDYCYLDPQTEQFIYIIPEKRPTTYKEKKSLIDHCQNEIYSLPNKREAMSNEIKSLKEDLNSLNIQMNNRLDSINSYQNEFPEVSARVRAINKEIENLKKEQNDVMKSMEYYKK